MRIKTWKKLLPDGAAVSKSGFRKKHLRSLDVIYIRRFTLETCRVELTHWVIFVSSIVFFIWNAWWTRIIMIVYAFVVNVPCIVTQRYNRIRFRRISSKYTPKIKGKHIKNGLSPFYKPKGLELNNASTQTSRAPQFPQNLDGAVIAAPHVAQ